MCFLISIMQRFTWTRVVLMTQGGYQGGGSIYIYIYIIIRVLIINHQNKIQPHQKYIVSRFFTLPTRWFLPKMQPAPRACHGSPWGALASASEGLGRHALHRLGSTGIELLRRGRRWLLLGTPGAESGQLGRDRNSTDIDRFISHRIHGAAIYGNIYHEYTPNVSIYTIHGSYGYRFTRFLKMGGSQVTTCLSTKMV